MNLYDKIAKNRKKNKVLGETMTESGNAFVLLFGAVGMVGVLGASTMTIMKGPVKSMSEVTKRTITENNMIATSKLAIIRSAAEADNGDCDLDDTIEPIAMDAAAHPGIASASVIPSVIGTSRQDSWGTDIAYCSWDYGTSTNNSGSCAGDRRLTGSGNKDQYLIAVISAGPDKTFQSICINYVDSSTSVISKPGGSDDLILGYTESDAIALSGGLWTIKTGDPNTAEIQKKLEVTDGTTAQLQFDAGTQVFEIGDGTGGTGVFPNIRTDYIDNYNTAQIEITSPVSITGGAAGTVDAEGAISTDLTMTATGLVHANAGIQVDGQTVIDDGAGWHRSLGATGWYSQTYGGGIYMPDANYVRTYGGKGFYADTANNATPAIYGNSTGTHYGGLFYSTGGHGALAQGAGYGLYGRTTTPGSGGVIGYSQNAAAYGILGHANAYSLYGNAIVRGVTMYGNTYCNASGGGCVSHATIAAPPGDGDGDGDGDGCPCGNCSCGCSCGDGDNDDCDEAGVDLKLIEELSEKHVNGDESMSMEEMVADYIRTNRKKGLLR